MDSSLSLSWAPSRWPPHARPPLLCIPIRRCRVPRPPPASATACRHAPPAKEPSCPGAVCGARRGCAGTDSATGDDARRQRTSWRARIRQASLDHLPRGRIRLASTGYTSSEQVMATSTQATAARHPPDSVGASWRRRGSTLRRREQRRQAECSTLDCFDWNRNRTGKT
jgi:hypothetical protein